MVPLSTSVDLDQSKLIEKNDHETSDQSILGECKSNADAKKIYADNLTTDHCWNQCPVRERVGTFAIIWQGIEKAKRW